MKNIILALFALSLVSCTSRYVQVSNVKSEDLNDSFEYINDELRLSYNFWAKGGSLQFIIENLSDQPIYIDWEHSNFIFNGASNDYFNYEERISIPGVYNDQSSSASIDENQNSVKAGPEFVVGSAQLINEKKSIQIPPGAYILSKNISLDFPWLKLTDIEGLTEKENTLLRIRTYIAYSKDIDLQTLNYIDNEFYVDGHLEMKYKKRLQVKKNNKLYQTRQKPDLGKTALLAVFIGILILVI